MAFDTATRNKLARMVAGARTLLAKEFTEQLQEIYGIQPDGILIEMEKLTHLDDEERAVAAILRDRVNHLANNMAAEKKPRVAAIDRMIREQAFTLLNRFAALRMCEERQLIQESIGSGIQSKGFKVYLQIAGSGLGDTYSRYKTYLLCLFDDIAIDLGVIFDRFSSLGLLFPREDALLSLLELFDDKDIQPLWTEDETIGWIYQYFNSQEERRQMRDASAAPRNSRELAVRNQFFTPRYVVEFLTDNTLGRIWYEMTQGETTLKDECRYLVRRPNEIFLSEGEDTPEEEQAIEELSQEDLLQQPVHIPFRRLKDPRQIRMLDPACGSMHFGLYAFDLYERIYEEAWEIEAQYGAVHFEREDELQSLHECFGNKEDFLADIPRLIIEHNIHGVDIDPRAVQIAGLSLWLRAQRNWQQKEIKQDARPTITRSNIVCAEPMPGGKNMLAEFTENLEPRVLGQLLEIVFDKMQLAGEAGSLLKIEEEIADAVEEAREAFNKEMQAKKDGAGYLPGMAPQKRQTSLFDFTGLTDETEFWGRAEEMIIDALQEYAGQAQKSSTNQRRLFARDAARGFAFIDLFRKRYDVVLMNPPFGTISKSCSNMIRKAYPLTYTNLACTFHERMSEMSLDGMLGEIIDIATQIRSSYQGYRRSVIYSRASLSSLCLLGWNVLDDANVETCMITLSSRAQKGGNFVACCDLRTCDEKAERISENVLSSKFLWSNQKNFENMPNGVPAFYLPINIQSMFLKYSSLDPSYAAVCTGVSTGDNTRFYKLVWEIPYLEKQSGWMHLSNGGDYCPFYRPWTNIIDWRKNGASIRSHQGAYIRNEIRYGKPGLTYGKRGNFLSVQIHPAERIITNEGQGIFPHNHEESESICALLNSTLLQVIINSYCGQHKENGYVKLLPIIEVSSIQRHSLTCLCKSAVDLIRLIISCSIEHSESIIPSLMSIPHYRSQNLVQSFYIFKERLSSTLSKANLIEDKINDIVAEAYNIDKVSRIYLKENSLAKPRLGSAVIGQIPNSLVEIVEEAIDYLIGIILGRWDIRIALEHLLAPKPADPSDHLPVCPPGMLVGSDGLPAKSARIVNEEWILARPDVNTLPPEGAVKNSTITDSEYPLRITWSGILVDDLGFDSNQSHQDDIVCRVRSVFDLLWKDKAQEIEQEACDILGVFDLRDYFLKPTKFFQDHLKRYSKSRRKAPIYWPLSTNSGSYTLWIYYHRLTDQTLFTCVTEFLDPKIKDITADIVALKEQLQQESSTDNRRKLEKLLDLESELKDFREELLRIANLPYKPNLNDGVMITAAPLWKLFRHRAWSIELQKCWQKLEKGDYDWAHLAYSIWPERVIPKCHKDRSLAIAHDLEEDLWEKIENGTDKQGNPKYKWEPKELSREDIQLLIRKKTGK